MVLWTLCEMIPFQGKMHLNQGFVASLMEFKTIGINFVYRRSEGFVIVKLTNDNIKCRYFNVCLEYKLKASLVNTSMNLFIFYFYFCSYQKKRQFFSVHLGNIRIGSYASPIHRLSRSETSQHIVRRKRTRSNIRSWFSMWLF